MSVDAETSSHSPPSFWRSARGRQLLWLAGGTLLVVIAAVWAISHEATRTAVQFQPAPAFPGFVAKAQRAVTVVFSDKDHVTHLRKGPDGRWTVAEAHDYPASGERLRKFFLHLAELQKIERKTEQAGLQATLGLTKKAATQVTVLDAQGKSLAHLMIGQLVGSGAIGKERAFIRADDAPEAYLAEGDLPLDIAPTEWLEQPIVDLPRDRVHRVTVTPATGRGYVLTRSGKKDPNFTLETLPPGRSMMSADAGNGVGAAAVNLTLDDVKPVSELNFNGAARIAFKTFDGLVLTFDIITQGETHWVRVGAVGPAGTPVAEEADAITKRTKDWAYAISEWKANLFTKPLESLLKTKTSEAKASSPK